MNQGEKRPLRVALFTDAHYARGLRTEGTRRCDLSLQKLEAILRALPPVDALINLGDLVNGTGDAARDAENIRQVKGLLSRFPAPCYHVLGNHDCGAGRKAVFLPAGTDPSGAYAFELGGVRFLALDANFTHEEVSYDEGPWNWRDAWIPRAQQQWLREQLTSAPGPVVVLCHQNLDDRGSDPHLVGNAAAVRGILEESGKVLCVLQGHCHAGAFGVQGGIPYYTFRALCEGEEAPFAILEIGGGHARVRECSASDGVLRNN